MSKGNQNSQVVDTETTKKEKKEYKPLWIIISFIDSHITFTYTCRFASDG